MRRKHIPQRTCVACRRKRDKRLLTRLVKSIDKGLVVDPTGKLNGRGAYLCDDPDCWQRALESKVLDRALNSDISDVERRELAAYRQASGIKRVAHK